MPTYSNGKELVVGMEHERKFSISPDIVFTLTEGVPFKQIDQVYTEIEPGRLVRFRKITESGATSYRRTEKRGHGSSRPETEVPATAEEYRFASFNRVGAAITKHRYVLHHGPYTIELDVFGAHLAPLVMAEVECTTPEQLAAFVPPEWFGREVTDDPRYENANLALHGIPLDYVWRERVSKWIDDKPVDQVLEELYQYLASNRPDIPLLPMVIGVAGGSASGKTSIVTEFLRERFGSNVCTVVSADDYFHGKRWMDEHRAGLTWDHPEAVDLNLLRSHILLLRSGNAISKPIYDFPSEERTGSEPVEPPTFVLVVDGLFTLLEPIRSTLDFGIFVNTSAHGRFLRRLIRDPDRTGQSSNDIVKYFTEVVHPMHEQYVQRSKPFADAVLENEYDPAIESQRAGFGLPQVKFIGTISEAMIRRLRLEIVGCVEQDDQYFATPSDGSDQEEILRLRCEGKGLWSVGYKGPWSEDQSKRPATAFAVDDATAEAMLRFGGPPRQRILKNRRLYLHPEGLVALDQVVVRVGEELRPVGSFIEFRFSNPNAGRADFERIATCLGLRPASAVTLSYREIASGITV